MDFIEFDTFTANDDTLPQPQPALSLPIASNLESLSKRLTNFTLANAIKTNTSKESGFTTNTQKESGFTTSTQLQDGGGSMDKYAQISLSLLENSADSGLLEKDESLPSTQQNHIVDSLGPRLARVFNETMSDATLKEIFTNIEENAENDDRETYFQKLVEPGFEGTTARKKLKGRIETDLIKSQSQLLKDYQPMIKQLKALALRLKKLNDLNKETNNKLNKNLHSFNDFNVKVNELNTTKNLVEIKQNLLIAFKKKFTLTEYEEVILTSGDLNQEFFQALSKAETIVENCSILLSEDNLQLGLKIMSKNNQIINKAVERTVTYCNKTLDNLYSLNSKSRLLTLHECFKYLKKRQNYLSIIVDKFTDSRSKVILEEFHQQIQENQELTSKAPPSSSSALSSSAQQQQQQQQKVRRRSSAKGTGLFSNADARPVYMSAHDPVRFVGDFLAYIHSLAVNESETIKNIFTMGNDSDQEFDAIIREITNKILKSLARPIRSKIEQIISTEIKLNTIFQIFNLVELYSMMFAKQLSESDDLVETMKKLVTSCQDRIFSIVSSKLATIGSSNSAKLELNSDLNPPEWIISFYSEVLHMIDQIITPTILNLSSGDHEKFLNLIINQPIAIFKEHVLTCNKQFKDKRDLYIIQFNFLDLIQSKIMPISLLSDKVLEINDMNLELTSKITELEYTTILKSTGLFDYYNIVNMICPFSDDFFEVSIYEPMKENKLYNAEQLELVNDKIQQYLPNAMMDLQQALLKLNSPVTVDDVINNVFTAFVKFYKKLNIINEEYLQYSFTWSDYDLATMLGIEDLYINAVYVEEEGNISS
ncbi:COG6 [Candida oxycetoniae]|uniref:Conserved oligomeric Golgi complex subunit 6 n=1 Tax=Candida oxycetoniae TaxID=497107 RepID=A0AAI9SYZ8_9ASCO|nr:COG6 [Candida oxycetoniae]KAI3405733.2 COG6 [Candida oxycetoniae]